MDVWADIKHSPWPSFCRCIHEKSMVGRWTWERGDAVGMDGGMKSGKRRKKKGGETVKQRETRGVIRDWTVTNIHSVRV